MIISFHFQALHGPKKCTHCDINFPNKADWQKHTDLILEKVSAQTCHMCVNLEPFSTRNKLYVHINTVHSWVEFNGIMKIVPDNQKLTTKSELQKLHDDVLQELINLGKNTFSSHFY